ncbi:MAG: 6,7-dimethyl-8-ribityllumazine synthase [bacterium]|uniref:6,7-dimethyl-8-ribityllumazine synthase n=2 Tax=Bacteria candidate phyla TaxID=1783234 RepID=A0A117M6L9_UNCT6|nr:MAG: 6,7-dimethyl-8-ribityllumazine synthase [candidate division TA06 bacterium 32_111]KUK87251.1 MAG: 6,7-dimethyl-8-ribityllumazine synthase [candidate division TA06 bacterium 34_109]MDI6700491.1 6,7-dimethyl-8-ribityllumazine synthase [bacterium]HAF07615.1 6,7-dimethyl-8-ribityllumazine synthase [candidate division WOR-3 bacterium]HCP16166.1 6,7-dimethyl-8-ribityllumazine synthase [candidate division WOR-3 bacterium]
MERFEGKLDGRGMKFAIVCSRFNNFISKNLIDGAVDCLLRHNVDQKDIKIYISPGAFEIPQVAKMVIKTNKNLNGIICLGTVIRGETPHFDYIASEVSKGIAKLNLDVDIPISFGIITADSTDQAIERAGTKSGNKGYDAAETVLELANLYKRI